MHVRRHGTEHQSTVLVLGSGFVQHVYDLSGPHHAVLERMRLWVPAVARLSPLHRLHASYEWDPDLSGYGLVPVFTRVGVNARVRAAVFVATSAVQRDAPPRGASWAPARSISMRTMRSILWRTRTPRCVGA